MPNVVSNSSSIIHLAKLGQIHLLRDFYGTILIPKAVQAECLVAGNDREEVTSIKNADWLKVYSVKNVALVKLLSSEIDEGESEAIALAIEQQADLILLDDADAREKAKIYKLSITGTLGILLRAKKEGKIISFADVLEKIRATGFWINDKLKRQFLSKAGEE